jgi:quercetin dioxygenase-like cupin family protein
MERAGLATHDTVEAIDAVHLSRMVAGDRTSIQGFEIEPGATVPRHSHPHEQAGFIHEGEFTFLVGDEDDPEELVLGPGDAYVIPGEEPHAAANRGDERVTGIDVFSPPRTDPDWAD